MQKIKKFRVWDNTDYMSKPFTLNELQAGLIQFDCACPIMQFTDLKDVNGNEIYEGDIVQVSGNDGYYVTAKVAYECGAFWFYAKNISLVFNEDCDNMVMLASMYIEDGDGGDSLDMVGVVGNIYENPDLLGGITNGKD